MLRLTPTLHDTSTTESDFYARVGRCAKIWTVLVDWHMVGNVNDNINLISASLQNKEHRPLITDTTSRIKDKHKGCMRKFMQTNVQKVCPGFDIPI